MRTRKTKKKDNKNRGRPSKKIKNLLNTGRMKKEMDDENVSKSTAYRRANEILKFSEQNIPAIKLAAKIGEKISISEDNQNDDLCTSEVIKHTNESALAFYLEFDFSKRSYEALAQDSKARNSYIYPCYKEVQKAMFDCKPFNYHSSETEGLIPLADLLNKTSERLCESIACDWDKRDLLNLELLVSLGFDSSSGHVNPNQKCQNSTNENPNAVQSLFISSMIIIQLKNCRRNELTWTNPTPQSTRLCRPIRIALEKEDDVSTIREFNRLNMKIELLKSHTFTMCNGKTVTVRYNVSQTLFDGKCINTIVGNKA